MNKGLKINNKKSNISVPAPSKEEALEKAAAETVSKMNEYKKRSWDLGAKFKSIMENDVLLENKTILLKNLESDILTQLSQLATEINNDVSIPEDSVGSVALIQLIMKMLIFQKDKINQLKFQIEKLENNLKKINSKNETIDSI